MMRGCLCHYVLKLVVLNLICTVHYSTTEESEESKISDEQAVAVTKQTLQALTDKLQTCKTNIAALTLPQISFISNELSFSVQNDASFENHLDNCFNSNGFIISDPQLLNAIPSLSELPPKLIIGTFNTKLLLSKPLSKVVREVQNNKDQCSIWNKDTQELTPSADCAKENLKSLCLSNAGKLTRETVYQHQFVFSIVPDLIQALQDSINEMSSQIVVHPDYINHIGTQLTAAGSKVLTMLQLISNNGSPLKYSILFYLSLINNHLWKARILTILSSQKLHTSTDPQIETITTDITTLKEGITTLTEGFQTLTDNQSKSQLTTINFTNVELQLKTLQLKQQELEYTVDQLNLKSIKQSLSDESNDDSSGLVDEYAHDENATLISFERMLKKLNYVKKTNRTIAIWPTNLTIKADSFYMYSVLNFYAAVLWAMLMAFILIFTTYQAHKRNQRISILEDKLSHLPSGDRLPKRNHPQPETKPLLKSEIPSKRRIVSAIHTTSKL